MSQKLFLDVNELQVASFDIGGAQQDSLIEQTAYPVCIVYVSDCVSCPPDDAGVVQ